MILSMGMGRRMGPVDLMHTTSTAQDNGMFLRTADSAAPDEEYFYHATDMSTEQVWRAGGMGGKREEGGEGG